MPRTVTAPMIVRKSMEEAGIARHYMFTNNYAKCRTVKCYVRSYESSKLLRRIIDKALRAAGHSNFSFKTIEYGPAMWRGAMSFIVRLPK